MADERRLKQVVLNLIRNAISFTPQGGKITLSLRRTDLGVATWPCRTRASVSPYRTKSAFSSRSNAPRQVRRAGQGKAKRGEARTGRTGAGLGLALVRNIVALHGGSVDLTSAPGKGTTVTVHLPREAAGASKP